MIICTVRYVSMVTASVSRNNLLEAVTFYYKLRFILTRMSLLGSSYIKWSLLMLPLTGCFKQAKLYACENSYSKVCLCKFLICNRHTEGHLINQSMQCVHTLTDQDLREKVIHLFITHSG